MVIHSPRRRAIATAVVISLVIAALFAVIVTRRRSSSPSEDEELNGPSNSAITIKSGGLTRSYRLSVPSTDATAAPLPVIFAFHGHSQNAALMEKYTDLDRLPALVVYPQGEKDKSGTQRAWESAPYATTNDGDKDSQLVRDILAQLDRKYRIDHTRICATGKSNGGGFAAKLACTMPETFAAVAPVAGAYYPATHTSYATGSTPNSDVSVLEIHGVKDGTMHYGGGISHGEHYVAAPELAGTFAQLAGCTLEPSQSPTSAAKVTRMTWEGCRPGVDVEHLAVADGGHNWPGSPYQKESGEGPYNHTLQTTDVVWAFLSRHHK